MGSFGDDGMEGTLGPEGRGTVGFQAVWGGGLSVTNGRFHVFVTFVFGFWIVTKTRKLFFVTFALVFRRAGG